MSKQKPVRQKRKKAAKRTARKTRTVKESTAEFNQAMEPTASSATQMNQSDPRYLQLESLVRNGILFSDMTAAGFWSSGKKFCVSSGFKGFQKSHAHRMHDYYRIGLADALARGEFHVAIMKLASRETDLKARMLDLCGKFTTDDVMDIRDHVSDYDAVHTGEGKPWRTKVVEVRDKMEAAGYDVSEVEVLVEELCPVELEASQLPDAPLDVGNTPTPEQDTVSAAKGGGLV